MEHAERTESDAAAEAPDAVSNHAGIERRAYEISQGHDSGTPEENWRRAAEELSREDGDRPETHGA